MIYYCDDGVGDLFYLAHYQPLESGRWCEEHKILAFQYFHIETMDYRLQSTLYS